MPACPPFPAPPPVLPCSPLPLPLGLPPALRSCPLVRAMTSGQARTLAHRPSPLPSRLPPARLPLALLPLTLLPAHPAARSPCCPLTLLPSASPPHPLSTSPPPMSTHLPHPATTPATQPASQLPASCVRFLFDSNPIQNKSPAHRTLYLVVSVMQSFETTCWLPKTKTQTILEQYFQC